MQRKHNRLRKYDYGLSGYYFVTICARNGHDVFGDVVDGVMALNDVGMICQNCLLDLPRHYNNVTIDVYVVMPDHIHCIFVIRDIGKREGCKPSPTDKKQFSLCEIVRGFKTFSSKRINQILKSKKCVGTGLQPVRNERPAHDKKFKWQRSFYDHIIRNNKSLNKIREYIINNPEILEQNKKYIENLNI